YRLARPGLERPIGVPVSDGLRVLIVEDVAAAAEFAARRLVQGGIPCTSIQVATEKDFRAVLRRLPPQLILSDLVLLEFDGLTALEIARKELPEVPVIFFSGTHREEHAIEALRRGAFDYVLKSNPTRLVPAVAGALREVSERARQLSAERQARETEQ